MEEKLLKRLLKINPREKIILAVLALVVAGLIIYQSVLAPYSGYLRAIRREYKTQKELINLKIKKSASLGDLKRNIQDYEEQLARVDRHFFTEEETARFMADLPVMAEQARQQVTNLKPVIGFKDLRTEILAKFVSSLPLTTDKENEIKIFLEKNQPQIDSGPAAELLRTFQNMMPADKQEMLRNLWIQAREEPLAAFRIKKIDLEVILQGPYQGLVTLNDWLASTGKLIELKEMQVIGLKDKSGEETRLILSIYQIY